MMIIKEFFRIRIITGGYKIERTHLSQFFWLTPRLIIFEYTS
jgi:hypothetical protein